MSNNLSNAMNNFANIPAEMKSFPNWLVWRLEDRGRAKPVKMPFSPRGGAGKVDDPTTWGTYDEALQAFQDGKYDGIGFVLTNTPFVGIDIDGCYDDNGVPSEAANQACRITRSYVEFSQSGKGLHIIMRGTLPPGDRRNTQTGFEMYGHGSPRYFATTGIVGAAPLPIREDQAAIDEIYARYVAKHVPETTAIPPAPATPAGEETGQDDDFADSTIDADYLKMGLERDEHLIKLYNGERPHDNESSDDMALFNKLAYWSNGNAELMKQTFFGSPHYAQKDDAHIQKCQRADYIPATISEAIASLQSTARVDDEAWHKGQGLSEYFEYSEDGSTSENTLFSQFEPFEPPDTSRNPSFPTGVMPLALQEYVEAVAEDLQVAVDMPAVSVLAVIALCSQKKFETEPKPGWRESVNLFAAIVASPSERKSPVQSKVVQPVHEYVTAENIRRQPMVDEYRMKCNLVKKKIESLSKAVAEGKQPKHLIVPADAELMRVSSEQTDLLNNPQDYLTLVADDITMEALSESMAANGEMLGLFSAEGGLFNILNGLYSAGVSNLDIVLKSFSGDFFQSNRIGRKKVSLQRPTLTICLMVQPTVLTNIMGNSEFKGRGLLARFCYAIPNSTVGNRRYDTNPVPLAIESRYRELVHRVLAIPYTGDPSIITFSPEAKAEAEQLFFDLESRLDGGDLAPLGEWGGKHHGRVMRIAALLHIAEHIEQSANIPVAGETIQRARVIGDYFIAHAITAHRFMGAPADKETEDAKYILKRLSTVSEAEISKRDLHQMCRSRFKKAEDMQFGLNVLINRGYIAICKEAPAQNTQNTQKGARGRPTEKVFINPLLASDDATGDV